MEINVVKLYYFVLVQAKGTCVLQSFRILILSALPKRDVLEVE